MAAAADSSPSSSGREKENFMDFDFACEDNGPVAFKSTTRDLKAAANRKARGPRHSQEVIAAGRLGGGGAMNAWVAEADSIMAEKATKRPTMTMLSFEKTLQRGMGSALGSLGNDKVSKTHKTRI